MTNKELMALPLDERRKIMEEQLADLIDYYKTTDLWEITEGKTMCEQKLVVYGANCCWWDYIENAGSIETPGGHNLPCCPHCGSVLLQINEKEWWEAAQRYEKDKPEPGYVEFIRWLRGKCFKRIGLAKFSYDVENPQNAKGLLI